MSRLRAQTPPLVTASYINLLLALRRIFAELAWMEQHPTLAHLIHTQDIPRLPHRLPRPLTAEQDHLLQQEFLRRNDLGANAFLLMRHTGMRIGECVDLSFDCLRSIGPHQWAVHIPLGKLKTERMVPVDSFVCDLVYRLRLFRSLDPLPADGRLFARRHGKEAILHQLRDYLHQICHSLGLSTRIVPHQFRHTYASVMLRAGVGFPALMKLLGHTDPGMTLCYLEVAAADLQREFQLARSKPDTLPHSPRPHSTRFEPVSTGSSIPSSRLNIGLRCFAVHSQMVTLATASTGFRTASRKSSPKLVNSSRPDPGQRLAGQVAIPYSSHGPPEPVGLLRVARQSGRVQRRPPLPKRDGLEHMLRSSGRLRHRYLQDGC